jgi:hypothetical protein
MSGTVNKSTLGQWLASFFHGVKSIIIAVYEAVCKILTLVAIIVTAAAVLLVVAYALLNPRKVRELVVDWNAGRASVTLDESQTPPPEPRSGPPSTVEKPPPASEAPPRTAPATKPKVPAPKRGHDVVFVLDHSSASYGGEEKLFRAAQRGAVAFLEELGDAPRLSLLLLHAQTRAWVPRDPAGSTTRDALRDRIEQAFCGGSLALYDGLADAIKRVRTGTTEQAASIVVLTAAKSDTSHSSLEDLRTLAKARPGRPVRLYPVVLGRPGGDAPEHAGTLKDLAALTEGRCCVAGPDDLENKLRQLARTLAADTPR